VQPMVCKERFTCHHCDS